MDSGEKIGVQESDDSRRIEHVSDGRVSGARVGQVKVCKKRGRPAYQKPELKLTETVGYGCTREHKEKLLRAIRPSGVAGWVRGLVEKFLDAQDGVLK